MVDEELSTVHDADFTGQCAVVDKVEADCLIPDLSCMRGMMSIQPT